MFQTAKIIKIRFFLMTGAVALFVAAAPARADKIHLKDGTSYEGKLLGKSERRYLFSVDADGEKFQMSFFPEDVEKLELDKESMERQTPYLKEVETFQVQVRDEKPRVYELSLYKESMGGMAAPTFTEKEMKSFLAKDEAEYYDRFSTILKRYSDKFAAVQNIYMNLTKATREDFAKAIEYMDDLYFELSNMIVSKTFATSHALYLDSIKASSLAFRALAQGLLDEAAKQIKISEETKKSAMAEFRQIILSRKPKVSSASRAAADAIPLSNNETANFK